MTAVVPLVDAPTTGHNRWHPDIPPAYEVAPGEELWLDVRDGDDHQVRPGMAAAELAAMELRRSHPLTGPVAVRGSEPGDVVEVEVRQIKCAPTGWTSVRPVFGLLRELHAELFLAHWRLADGVAVAPELPGIAIPGRPFLGVMGVAPSPAQLRAFASREAAVAERGDPAPQPAAACAVPGGAIGAAGLRTVPPRENGGNMDVKQLTVGSTLLLPVFMPGALVSVGDLHFAQGDGESSGTAIETYGRVRLRFGLRRAPAWRPTGPAFLVVDEPPPVAGPWLFTTGIPVDDDGVNHTYDVRLAARNALREMLSYLEGERGLTRSQAIVVISVAVDLRIGSIVNDPNALVTAALPLSIFTGGPGPAAGV